MDKEVQMAGVDRETRRWVFDGVAWLLGIVLAAMLVAEAAAGERRTASREKGMWLQASGACQASAPPGERALRAVPLPQ